MPARRGAAPADQPSALYADLVRLSVLLECFGLVLDTTPEAYDAASETYATGTASDWVLAKRTPEGALDRDWLAAELRQAAETLSRVNALMAQSASDRPTITQTLHFDLIRFGVLLECLDHALDTTPAGYDAVSDVYARQHNASVPAARAPDGTIDRDWFTTELEQGSAALVRFAQVLGAPT